MAVVVSYGPYLYISELFSSLRIVCGELLLQQLYTIHQYVCESSSYNCCDYNQTTLLRTLQDTERAIEGVRIIGVPVLSWFNLEKT